MYECNVCSVCTYACMLCVYAWNVLCKYLRMHEFNVCVCVCVRVYIYIYVSMHTCNLCNFNICMRVTYVMYVRIMYIFKYVCT